jgi:hypothetical protein
MSTQWLSPPGGLLAGVEALVVDLLAGDPVQLLHRPVLVREQGVGVGPGAQAGRAGGGGGLDQRQVQCAGDGRIDHERRGPAGGDQVQVERRALLPREFLPLLCGVVGRDVGQQSVVVVEGTVGDAYEDVAVGAVRLEQPGGDVRLAEAEASRPCRKCRLPAVPVSNLGSRNSPSGASIGATPARIHCARSVNSRSIAAARTSVLAVTSGVSTDSIRTGIRMFGVSPAVTSTSARAPQRRHVRTHRRPEDLHRLDHRHSPRPFRRSRR